MPDEIKEIPQGGLASLAGRAGHAMQRIGETMAGASAPLAAKHPIKTLLSDVLLTSPLQAAGAALQDYSGTPRDATAEYPYRARLFDPRQPAMIDPRALDLAQFAAPVAGRVRNAASSVGRQAGEALNTRMLSGQPLIPGLPGFVAPNPLAFVVKPKGGNWVPGDVEGSMTRLKSAVVPDYERYPAPNVTDEAKVQSNALRGWIDTKLARYLKNELATPEDPVRALAERGVTHMQVRMDDFNTPSSSIMRRRAEAGQDPMGAGTSPLAKQWDYLADQVIGNQTARDLSSLERESVFGGKLVPSDTPVHYMSVSPLSHLDLGHLIDELRNAMRPESGLPRNLQLTPEQLSKVTMPQAVERVAKINEWRAAQKAEATAAGANNAAVTLHREYPTIPGTDAPNERGLRWMELTSPNKLPEKFSVSEQNGRFNVVDTATGDPLLLGRGQTLASFKTPEEAVSAYYKQNPKALEDALQYEGDAMGHCAGGYCPDVSTGRKRIYSLRDAKGQPHVTIETRPGEITPFDLPPDLYDEYRRHMAQGISAHGGRPGSTEWVKHFHPEVAKQIIPPEQIVQIKGKGNRKPNDEYLPFVQDFVRSSKWSGVGDLQNTNLIDIQRSSFPWPQDTTAEQIDALVGGMQGGTKTPRFTNETLIRKAREDLGHNYVTEKEYSDWLGQQAKSLESPEGYAKGGAVKPCDCSQDTMQMQVWDKALRRQTGGASEPTQAEIEAAMRPETVSPRLRAFANKVKAQPGVPITDRLVGAGEAATSLASGILGSIPAGYEGMAELLRSRDPARAAQAVETGLQRYTYQPRTATGMQEAQAGAHLLEKLDAPSQYVGNYMLEQTGSPAAATAAQIILDPLNFLPGPKQLASTVRGVPQMLQDAAIQAYGPGATASHVVPPQGNLNLTPHASAELLKGPDRQPVGNFLKQLQGTPGVTKEGLEEGLAATRVLDPTSVITKAEFEKYATPSKYEKFEIEHDAANSEYHQELFEQAVDDVQREFQDMSPFEYLGYEMGIPPRYAEDFNTLVQQTNMPHFADATSLSELEAYGIPRELITLLERNDITTPDAFDRAIDDHTRQAINEQAEVRVEMHLAEQDEPTDYNTRQRLVTEDSRAALPFTAYQEIGVRHPNQQDDYKHFPGQQNMVGHFRGTMVPADWRRGVELENGAGTIPPGAFLIEELQSDAQQSGDTTKHLHQVHGVVAKAAIQHALEQGAHTVYVPTSSAIIDVREGLGNNDKNTLRRVYDKEVPSQAIEPLRKIPGVTITTTNPTASTNPKDRKFLFHVITFTDAAREHILRGLGQRTPGYAKGGPVSRDAMQMQVWDKALQRQTGGASEPTQAEIEAAMRPETISPHIRAFSNKLKANVTPPESVMDPRYAPWKKNLDQAEAFNTAADIVLSAAPLVGPALSLGRKAATSIGRQAGEALNTRILSGQGMVPGMPDMFAPNPLAFVVKPKGGNMLPDAVEAATAGLRRPVPSRATDNYGNEVPNPLANTDTAIENMALNNFIDTKINRYIKNEMATPEDPVRALAERGILHFEPNIADAPWLYENPAALARRRAAAGYPKEGLAQTQLGRSWETLTDQSLKSRPVSSIIASLEKRKLPVPDWMAKLEPTTPFYDPEIYNDALGLTHVMDELRNAMNPLAGLPRELMLKPETLSKLTLPQAIERVADINAWRLKQSETAMIANTLKADVHKAYSDTGASWVKLNKPGQFAAESDAMGHSVRGYEPTENGGSPSYGHGGWNAIKSGRAEIYSLRDAKKQPQVTIEVLRNNIDPSVLDNPYEMMDAVYNKAPASKHAAFARWIETHADVEDLSAHILASPWVKYLPQTKDARLSITQIKGKGNGQPKPEYLPMIQDFIRSGQWDDIRDLRNAGLQQLPDKRLLTLEEFNAGLARLKKSRTVSANDKNYASDTAGFNYRVADDASFWDRVKHFWDTPAEPVKTVKPIKRAKGGPISRDAMWMAVQDKQLRKKHGN